MDDNKKSDAPLQPTKEENVVASEKTSKVQKTTPDQTPSDPSDKLTPDHPRFKDVLRRAKEAEADRDTLRQEMKELNAKIEARQTDTGSNELTPDEVSALDRIDISLRTKKGYVTKEDLAANTRELELARNLDKLDQEYNGQDGLPKFKSEDVIAYAKTNGFPVNYKGLKAAHYSMNQEAFIDIEAKKRAAGPQTPSTESPASPGDRELVKGVTPKDVSTMSDVDYEKNRQSLKDAIRPKTGGTGM